MTSDDSTSGENGASRRAQESAPEPFEELLSRAVESRSVPAETVDLLKSAFTWRTIDAELMEQSYDSADDLATVRTSGTPRAMEFTTGSWSVVIEIDPSGIVRGQVFGPAASRSLVILRGIDSVQEAVMNEFASFTFAGVSGGHYRIELAGPDFRTVAFVVG